ncbi:hypothetical protein LAZ67_3004542, partial [Cordylochernes scorpioides]
MRPNPPREAGLARTLPDNQAVRSGPQMNRTRWAWILIGICEALIDTGADLSVVDLSTALNTGLEIINPDKMCSGHDGKELDIVGNIVLNIKFDDETITHQFVIMRTHLRIFILGRDFLKKMNAKIDCQREIIKYDLTGNRDVIKYQQKKIKSAKDAIIPELSIELIKEKEQLKQVLEKYADLFSSGLGSSNLEKHRIDTEGAKPLKHKPYRVSAKEREIIKEQIDEMLRDGIIRPSSRTWSFPVILVKKRDGKYRFCVDYRKLNDVIVKDVYPIPRIDEVSDTLQGSKYFSAIDLKSGYWQVEVEEKDKQKTAFTTAHGLYEFNVMPFGLCNAPATFERKMKNMLDKNKEGMNVEDFDALKDLSITNQLKKKVPNVLRNHLIDDWTKINNPDVLADKLDEYENVRAEMGPPHWNSKHTTPPSFQQKSARFPNRSEVKETEQGRNVSSREAARNEISEKYPNTSRRMVNRAIRNDKGEPKCFNCNQFGHIARDCPVPKATLTCRGCGQTGHKERNCTRPKEGLKVANLEVEGLKTVPPDVYLKDAKIDNKETVKAMIDTGSSSCLLRESVARRINVDIEPDSTSLYGIGNQTASAARTVGKTTVDLEIDGVVGKEIAVFIVNDDAQPYDLLIGRTWTDLPYVSFARIGVDDCVNSLLEVVDGKTTVTIISVGKGNLRVKENQCIGRVELLSPDDIVVNLDVSEDSFQTKSEEKREGQDQMKRKRPILPEDVNINHSLTPKERQEILDVVNEYRDCFALGMGELGCTDVTKMDIKEVDGSKPVCLRPYKTTASEREAIREIVREWKDNGIVTETRSPYASPVLLVRKKTGDHRLVVDYRRLNIQTIKDKFPLPRIDDLLEGPLLNKKAFCYLDDVIIPAKDWREMIERLREVLERIRSAKLTLKPSKCEFGRREVEFLGYVISTGGLKPGPRKIKAREEFPEPKNVHDIRRFLGLTNFFRRFVKDFARKAEPLSRFTKKGTQFEWKEEQRKSFGGLRNDLVEYPVLAHYNPELKTEVHCDASAEVLAGMLLQEDEDCKWRLVYCVSKKTTEAEKMYHSSKLELMAIVWTVDRLREKMAHVDGMSRAPVDDPRDTMEEIVEKNLEVCFTITLEEQIMMIQHSDPELRDLIQIFRKDPCDRTVGEQNRINDYSYKGGRPFRMVKNGEEERALYVIPKSMRKSLVVKFHDLMGHFAVDRTVNKIKELYWFPSMKRYVRRHVARCVECLFNKVPGGKQQGFLHPIKPGKRPFSIVHMDHVGPFVRSTRGNQELLVIVDNLTRFVRLSPVRNTSTQNVLKVMKSFVNDFELPDKIISDRGSCFTSRQFEEFCRGNGIHHTLNSTKHPQGNGMVERVNRTVLSTIAIGIEDPRRKDWDLKIKEVERDLNNAVNKTTNKTPFETLHGYSPRFHDGILRRLADEDMDPWTDPEKIQESVRTQIENKQEIMKMYYDKKKCCTLQFEVGEIVVIRHVPKMTGEPTKAQPKYRGPLIITEVLPSDTYRVTQLSERTGGRFYTTTAHISQLKSWHSEEDDSTTEESPDEESEEEDTLRRNPRRSCNAKFNRGRLESRNGRMVLAGIEGIICYIDDVLIATVSVEKHLAVLKTVFLRLEKYNIKLKKDKCKFVQREIEYFGHLIKEDGIRPLDHKVQALQKAKSPTNISELRSFLGLVNYYGKFIPNLPDLLRPLHELLHKNNCWSWTKECEEAIEKCKSSITSERVFVPYDTTLPLFLATDASQIGIGAVLSHVIGGQERPIMFASRTLSGAERNYSQIEREALAIIYGVTKFHQFIYGRRFTLITDHKPLVSILGPKSGIPTLSTSRLQRWAIILSAYTYDIKFKKTQDHGNADLLSRLPVESEETSRLDNIYALSYMEDLPITAEEIRIETQKDEVLSIVKCYTQHGWPERVPDHLRPYFQRKLELTVDGECLLWGMRVIIPSSLRPNLLSCLHETHSGMSKMKSVARSHFWWPNLDNEIEFLVNRCRNCQQVQDGPNRVKWQPWIRAVRPWQRIHIDYANKDNINLLIVVDSHSKWVEAFPITPHETTKKTPSELFIGRSLRTRLSIIHPNLESRVKEQQARQMKYDYGSQKDEFGIDDLVWCRNFRGGDRWIPGRIVGRIGSRVYTVLIHGQVKSYHRDQIRKRWENGADEDRQYGRQREETDIPIPEANIPNRGRSESPPIETARQQRDSGLVDQNDGGISGESSRSPDPEAREAKPDPSDLVATKLFLSREGKAFAKICLGINDEQQLHVQHLNTPKEVWEELEKLYAPKDSRYRAVQLRRQLYGERLTQHSNMEGYMGKINYIVNELAQIGDKIDDGDLAMVLLGGLPEDWDIVVSTICNLPDSDFTTATVKRRLLAEAERRSSNLPKDVGAMVVNASSKPIETEKQFKAKVVCFKCGSKGHYARECRKKGKNEQRPKRFDQNKGVNMSAMCNTLFGATAETWIIDSGATHHMTPKRDYFTCLKECTSNMSSIIVANGSSIEACGIGTVSANIVGHKGDASKMVAQNTLYVPDMRHSVLSVLQMIENGRKVVFNKNGCHIMDMKGKLLIEGKKLGRLYYVQTTPSSTIDQNDRVSLVSECKEELTLELWHKRLMHVNAYTIEKMAKNQSVRGLDCSPANPEKCEDCSPAKPEKCEDCLIGKSYRLPFLQLAHKEEKEIMPLDLVHADLMGPLDVLSWGGAKYVLTIIDESTRYTSVFFLKNKGGTLGKVKEWIQESEKQTSRKLKRIRTDNGLEFCSKEWDTFCKSVGIVHEHTMTYTPQQNGVAERMNRTLLDLVRSTISGSGLPKASWAELTYTAAYVRNRVLNNHNGESTPYELWTGNKPSLKHLRAIGCQVFVHIPRQVRKSKLERRAVKGNLVGYALRGRGYRVWIPEMKKVVESRDCVFKESDVSRNDSNREVLPSVEHYSYGTQREIEENPVSLLDQEDVIPTEEDSHNQDTVKPSPTRSHPMILRNQRDAQNSIELLSTEVNKGDPTSYKEAIQGPEAEHWLEAIEEELESLRKHNVWELTELPKDSAPIACRWVLHKKTNAEGQVVRYKARLVAKGFTQQKGIDYDEIYSPVSSFETTRLLTAIGVENNWFIDQYDVKSAYLYGKLDRVIYMEQPEGFVKPGEEHLYCQLKRSLYGLKQSGRCWNKCLDEWLKKKGFVRNPVDPCVYKLKLNEGMIILSLYVDDILTLTENQEVREKCIELLRGHFETKYIGPVSYLLGVNFTRSKGGCVTLTQRAYIKSLLERFNLQEGREVSTPMETRPELHEEEDEENCQDLPYRELIGGLLYISQRTRPDIAYAVSQLARYCSKYTRKHWVAAKRILRYLKSSEHLGITYRRTGEQLCAYSDADWGTNLEDRKSTSGYVVMFAGAPILWRSSKQTVTALSTMEAEYISLSSSVREVTWIRVFLNHLDISHNMVEPTPVWCDNQAAIAHAKSYISRSKTRHIAIRYHFVREKVDD